MSRKSLQKTLPSFKFKSTSSVIKIAVKLTPRTWEIQNLLNSPKGKFLFLQPFAPLPNAMRNYSVLFLPQDSAPNSLPKGEKQYSTPRQFNLGSSPWWCSVNRNSIHYPSITWETASNSIVYRCRNCDYPFHLNQSFIWVNTFVRSIRKDLDTPAQNLLNGHLNYHLI